MKPVLVAVEKNIKNVAVHREYSHNNLIKKEFIMLVREWMTEEVISVTPETSMLKASKLLKDHKIRRLPVIDADKKIVGILSYTDIKDASPSKATTLDIHELHYLLSEIKVKDVMTKDPITVAPTDTIEHAVMLMEDKGFGSLPVLDENDVVKGIITDHDLFRVYAEVTGARNAGIQIALQMKDVPGATIPLLQILQEHNASLITLLSTSCSEEIDCRKVYIHLHPLEKNIEEQLIKAIRSNFNLLYWVKDKVYEK